MKRTSLIGARIGQLVVVTLSGQFAECLCSCGNSTRVWKANLYRGNTRSCGCLHKTAGGLYAAHKPEWNTWNHMLRRCRNRRDRAWANYGGRGIDVCHEWDWFPRFLADMGTKPHPAASIERIDNNKGYCQENCKWAMKSEQASNTRKNRFLVVDGRRMTFAQAIRKTGINASTFYYRLARGISPPKAICR